MRRFALLLLAPVLAGCVSLAPPYHRPTPAVPEAVANSEGAPEAAPRLAPWRAFFGDPRLQQVIDLGLAHNQDLPAAVANVQIARAAWLGQRSQLFPSLNGALGASGSRTPAALSGLPASSGAFTEQIYSAEFAVPSYELDLFGRVRSLTKAAQEQYFASQAARDAVQISLVGQIAQDWLTVGADRSLLAIAQATLVETTTSLTLTQAKLDHGEAAQSDVDRAQGLASQARAAVAAATTQVAEDRDALEFVAGAPVAETLLPTSLDDESGILGQLPSGVASSVLLARPDVVQAEDQLIAANANIGAARAAFFPSITLTGSAGLTSTALSSLFTGGAGAWSYAAQLTQPIFDAGKNRAGLAQAKAQRDLAQANYQKAIQTAFRETADALARRGRIGEQLAAEQAQVAADADAMRLIQVAFARGSASELDLLTAQGSLDAALQAVATTRLLAATNVVALYQALGGGLS
ncbi:MAG TPA: efflux transporter outer membrane subunit [Caulobacteraceae bacterium]|jgi:multidrug efflux system outer membrane protein